MKYTVDFPDDFMREYNEMKRIVKLMQDRMVDSDFNEILEDKRHVEPMSVTQIISEYEISRPTLSKYTKKGLIKLVNDSPRMYDKKDVIMLLKAVKPRLYG